MKIIVFFKAVLQIILFVILAGIIFTVVTSRISLYGIRSYTVASGSMIPTLPIGSVIYIKAAPQYNTGDIITFKRDDETISHRIVAIKNGKFQTKGDANKQADQQLVDPKVVYGKEFFELPIIGKLTSYTRTLWGYLLLIAIPTFLFVGFEVWAIKEEYRKEIEKKLLKQQEEVKAV